MTNDISYFNDTHEQVRHSIEKFVTKEISPFINDWEEACEYHRNYERDDCEANEVISI
jgi:hypothetical protein